MKKSLLFIVSLFVACANNNEVETINIDIDKAIKLDVSNAKVIQIQEDSVFLNDIAFLNKTADNYILNDANRMLSYDLDGRLVSEISRMGRASEEYTFVFQAWTIADTVFIYDMGGNKIISYDVNGNYIGMKRIDKDISIRGFCRFRDGYILETLRDTIFTFYDVNLEHERKVENIMPPNKAVTGYFSFNYKDKEVLLQKIYETKIYAIDSTFKMSERYNLDFGSKTLPKELANDMSKLYEASQNYVMTYFLLETDDDIVSVFFFQKDKYLNKYNKKNKVSTCYLMPDGVIPFYTNDAELILSSSDENGHKTLTIVPL